MRKEKLTSPRMQSGSSAVRALLFAPLQATLTVEATIVLPLFLFCMITALRYCSAIGTAVQLGTALSETGKSMAAAAYATKYAGDTGTATAVAAGALSAVYAQNSVTKRAGDVSGLKHVNMALSSFLQEEDVIDLVLTYQISTPFGIVKLPGNFFIQRARVRAWTGRSTAEADEGEDEDDPIVYVTETGSVYHIDADCTYLQLSVRSVDIEALYTLRNSSGAKYYACELCGGDGDLNTTVYITEDGTRYHNTLSCSGLKRTTRQIPLSEAGDLRACSRCG